MYTKGVHIYKLATIVEKITVSMKNNRNRGSPITLTTYIKEIITNFGITCPQLDWGLKTN